MSSMDISKILEYLPHRYPFLLVDRVLSCEPGKRLVALKNVTINEPFFQGHFPHHPVMPGVLIIEAMAQACAILTFHSEQHQADERLGLLFCRHRQRPVQEAGGARRHHAAGSRARAPCPRHLEIHCAGHGSGTSWWPKPRSCARCARIKEDGQ